MTARHALTAALALAVPVAVGAVALQPRADGPDTRTYYVAADEVDWDYVPSDRDVVLDRPVSELFNSKRGPDLIGKVYRKAIYREYTDSTFTELKERPPEWEHLGILGPMIRAQVGDTIRVVFRNQASRPYSMHPHGVFYDKDSEGALYEDGTAGADKADDGVPTGEEHVYTWVALERTGPAAGSPSNSAFWMYHSHVDEGKDVNAGLVGPMIVYERGALRPDGSVEGLDREFVVMFAEFTETYSWYIEENYDTYADGMANVDFTDYLGDTFIRNLMETVNGYSFGTLPGLEMTEGDRVRWYVMGLTNAVDTHTPHWHGQTVTVGHMRTDMVGIAPMEMLTADMVPDNPGTWLFHCHVSEHMNAGMSSKFTVRPRAE